MALRLLQTVQEDTLGRIVSDPANLKDLIYLSTV